MFYGNINSKNGANQAAIDEIDASRELLIVVRHAT